MRVGIYLTRVNSMGRSCGYRHACVRDDPVESGYNLHLGFQLYLKRKYFKKVSSYLSFTGKKKCSQVILL